MRILILSCNTGEGHNTAGRAVLEQARAMGLDAHMEDMMLLAGRRTSKIVGGAYVGMVKHVPGFFHAIYHLATVISSPKRKSPVYYANTLMAKHLLRYLQQHPCDVIVTPHLFPAETLTYLKKRRMLRQKVVAVATDYTCIPFWEETDCDYYILPHRDLMDEFMQKGVPRQKLLHFGITVSMSFCGQKDKRQAKKALGLSPEAPVYLIMSGSMGFGKVTLFARRLAGQCKNGEQIVIICGRNERLEKLLSRQFAKNENVRVVGFTSRVADFLDACDVVFTKPGGLSSTEAAAKHVPIVHTSPIPGCETKNLEFFTNRGLSFAAKQMGRQISFGSALAHDAKMRQDMINAQKKQINPCAARAAACFLKQLEQEVPS